MTPIELLQQVGLSKYEAEAYCALLAHGPLTGYEVGKRSSVPLSRSYEILERLTQKGLALLQPGDPPRYRALEPRQFLGEVRSSMETTLDRLARELSQLPGSVASDEFWVVRGRQPVLDRARSLISQAQHTLDISLPTDELSLDDALLQAHGCRVFRTSTAPPDSPHSALLILLADSQEALIGTISAGGTCQAIVSSNAALLTALRGYFAHQQFSWLSAPVTPTPQPAPQNWLAWEDRKQRRLHSQDTDNRVA